MKTEALAQHRWLQQMVGEWEFESECNMGPGQALVNDRGVETVRMFGDIWMISDSRSGDGDSSWSAVITLGYDPKNECFVGSFIASMMTNMWIYKGQLDKTEKTLTLDTEGPNFADGKITRYQDIVTMINATERTLTSQMWGEDNQWHPFMKALYRRKS